MANLDVLKPKGRRLSLRQLAGIGALATASVFSLTGCDAVQSAVFPDPTPTRTRTPIILPSPTLGLPTPTRTPTPTSTPTETPTLTPLATLTPTPLPTPTDIPFTPTPTSTPRPTLTQISIATATSQSPDRRTMWQNTWPDTPAKTAAMFGGNASDWKRSADWDGTKKATSTFYSRDYYPIEWVPANPNSRPYYWPETQLEAAEYFFPGQKLDPKWMRRNQYGAWELMQGHWTDGSKVDLTITVRPGVVVEGYFVGGDDVAENDRNWVAWGGPNNGVNAGIAMPLAKAQGSTFWPPGTDPNKIGIEGKPYNTPYYTGAGGRQLGPNPLNFTPIYNAPGFDIQSRLMNGSGGDGRDKSQAGSNPPRITRPQDLGPRAMAYQKNPLKGVIRF